MVRGAIIQLQAIGEQDCYLVGNPQMTYWKCVYKRHSNYSMEDIEQYIQGDVNFGKKVFCELQRIGDLVNEIYLNIDLPSLEPLSNRFGREIKWLDALGHIIIKRYYLQIGEYIIDENYSQWMEIWSELTLPSGKRGGYDIMIGRIGQTEGPLKLRIPIKFWFNRNCGCAFPLLALQNENVRIYFEFRAFNECITDPTLTDNPDTYFSECGCDRLQHKLWVNYIFLESYERRLFLNPECILNYLIQRPQVRTEGLVPRKNEIRFNLNFNHPVQELIWTIQRQENIENNNWFNFSASIGPVAADGGDTIDKALIRFENQDRFHERDGFYFRIEQQYRYHTNVVPENYFYVYSFAQKPESMQPSGHCNFSRLDNKELILTIPDSLREAGVILHITVWARSYNLFRISKGFAELVYLN